MLGSHDFSRQPDHDQDLFGDQLGVLAEASHLAPCPTALFATFVRGVAEALSGDLVQLLQCVPHEVSFVLRSGWGFEEGLNDHVQVPGGLLSQAGRALLDPQGQPVVLEDFSRPHDWADDELVVSHGAKSGMVVKVADGTKDFGALGVFHRAPRTYTTREVLFLRRAAALLAGGFERIQRVDAAIAWHARTELLRAGAALTRVPAGRDELLCAAALAAVGGGAGGSQPIADWCFADALVPNGSRPQFERVAVDQAGGASEHLKEAFSVPLPPTAPHGAPRAYATRQAELVDPTDEAFSSRIARDPSHKRAIEEVRPHSYVCAPVVGRDRFYGALGFLRVESGTSAAYDSSDREAFAEFATLVGVAIDAGLPRPDLQEAREAVRAHAFEASGKTPASVAFEKPTDKQQEVIERLADGLNMEEIAREMHLGYSTIKTHRKHVQQKLGIKGRCQDMKIVAEARRRGWLAT